MKKPPLAFIADDDDIMLTLIEAILLRNRIHVKKFHNGEELIDAVRKSKQQPDFIILDQMMPTMDGLATMKALANNSDLPFRIPIMLLTGLASIPLAVEFMKSGGYDFIQKPLDVEYLNLKIKCILKYSSMIRKEKEMRAIKERDTMKTSFLSNVSHEIRTPMHAISSFAVFAEDDIRTGQTDSALDAVCEIRTASEKLMRIINDLLDLSKIEAGKMEFIFEKNDISACIVDVATELSPIAENKGVSLTVLPHDNGSIIEANFDYGRIAQVIRNLLTNAIKFCDQDSEIEIRITTKQGAISVSIVNQGEPIPKKEHKLIFDKFFRSHDSSKNVANSGTGLGLPLCKEIIAAHGGSIAVQSCIASRLTEFKFSIPLKKI